MRRAGWLWFDLGCAASLLWGGLLLFLAVRVALFLVTR